MQISNQTLIALLVGAIALVGVAVWLTLRPPPPPSAMVGADAEETIVEMPPEVYRFSDSDFSPRGPVTVRAEESTLVRLDCDGLRMDRTVTEGEAVFDPVPPAGCELHFVDDETAAPFDPVLPGDEIMCHIDEGRVVCAGSLAEEHGATVTAWSWGLGEVRIDGERVGVVPIEGLRLPIGKHKVEFIGEKARSSWTLTVQPDERIEVFFHAPARDDQNLPRRPKNAVMMPPQP